ncbi:MAG: EamA family transporter [Candidatus Marinimicrobia bacterium]|jgi:drug/metabolite transporter (DMT)-like permease|nr:EamA family transporter [Candidatus Neomarinimicrobiota bacterium]MBT3633398.1 EamA family transporter [Candidatus Neomarinimicrobiota bacterium]MBT3681541.1 EamA family transporter [Candidatus Neomarinimicrobiota bacterium]MBT3758492.1 EamA family transporter [Candidatus Neomarinimicrobiota bacterium]MBT3894854.1 EamA family transporter [Candidatus Neomarinimicrobiota bacterium]
MALLSAFLFGAATPASKYLLDSLPPFQLAGLLYLGAALAVAPAALKSGGFALPPKRDHKNQLRLLGAVFFGGLFAPVVLLIGLQNAGAASVSLWLNLELAATAVLGVFIFKDHLSAKGWFGVAAALIASVLLVLGPDSAAGLAGLIPGILVALACISWGLDNHFTALIDSITPSQSTFWKGLAAGMVNLTIGMIFAPANGNFELNYVLFALIVGALSYGTSIVLYIHSAQSLGATRAQVLFACAPIFGVLLSVIMLNESLTIIHFFSAVLFIVGVGFLIIEDHNHLHHHDSMDHNHLHSHNDGHHDHFHPDSKPSDKHRHAHSHYSISHRHVHWPDLHHRHEHTSKEE